MNYWFEVGRRGREYRFDFVFFFICLCFYRKLKGMRDFCEGGRVEGWGVI